MNGRHLGYFPDRPSAEKFLAENQHKIPKLINTTVAQIYERWQKTQNYKKLSDGAKYNYGLAWKKLSYIKNMFMREIKTTHFQNCINKANENGCGRDGCSKIKNLCSKLCQEAKKDDIIDRNYAEGIELPEYVKKVARRNLTDEEIITLLYHDSNRNVRIILCLIYTGVRIGELFGILKENVFLDKKYMIGGEKTEEGKNRVIPIRDEIFPYVENFMKQPGKFLIMSSMGKKMNSNNFRNREFYTTLDEVGINYKDENGNNVITPHRTRHTYVAESIKAGIKPEALMKIVGHAQYTTTVNKYDDDVNIEYLKSEANKGF